MSKILIKSAKIIDKESSHHNKVRDILIVDGLIKKIGKLSDKADKEINAKGMILSVGWCDMRAWLADPGMEHKEDLKTGRNTAMEGGFTHVAVLPNNDPVTQNKNDVTYISRSNENELTQLLPIAAVTQSAKGEELTEMIDLHHAGAVAFSDGLKPIWHSDILLKSLQYLQKFDGLIIDRPEDIHLNMFGVMNEGENSTMLGMKGMPALGEDLIVERNLSILEYTGGRLHFACLSSAKSIALVKAAQKRGLQVTCDIASYQPLFDDGFLSEFDTNYKVNPPLRDKKDNKAIIKALKEDTISALVSNHTPHDEESKKLEFDLADFGIIGLQTVAANIAELSNEVPMESLIEKVSNSPRKLLKINTETIEEGTEADLTLFAPDKKWRLSKPANNSKSENSPYYEKELKGRAIAVFNNGSYYISSI